jgi:hypothetical protein
MVTDPEELLRSIERTREEVAHTVDTKRAARQSAANVRGRLDGLTAKVKGGTPTDAVAKVTPYLQKVPKPALGAGLAALVAIAAVLARRRSR